MTFLPDPVPPLMSIVNSPQCRSLTLELNYSLSSVFRTILELLFCLDLASWPSILLPRSSILTLCFSLKLSSLYYLFLNSTFMYCLCWQCQCVKVSCTWERERYVCVCVWERGMWEREIERVCERKCPTARVCVKLT